MQPYSNGNTAANRQYRDSRRCGVALNCEVGAIAKSLVFRGVSDDGAVLAILSGARRVSLQKLSQAVGGSVSKANAAFVKEKTVLKSAASRR